jgi:hypothetical protein
VAREDGRRKVCSVAISHRAALGGAPTTEKTRPSATRGPALLRFGRRCGSLLRLRVADSLRQHLSKFGLGLCLLARLRFPCRHQNNMGIPTVKLKHPRNAARFTRKVVELNTKSHFFGHKPLFDHDQPSRDLGALRPHEPLRRQPAADARRVSRLSRSCGPQRRRRRRNGIDALGHAPTAADRWAARH